MQSNRPIRSIIQDKLDKRKKKNQKMTAIGLAMEQSLHSNKLKGNQSKRSSLDRFI